MPRTTAPTAASSSRATTIARHRVSAAAVLLRAALRGPIQDSPEKSPPSPLPFAGRASTPGATTPGSSTPGATTPGSSTGTIGRPRAASGARTPSSRDTVSASSSTERGSREIPPGSEPSPQTTNGTGRSPQSRWPWPPIPRPWPWSAIRITVAPSSLPRSSRKARKSPTWRSVSASWSRYSVLRTPRTCPSWSAASSWSTSRSGSSCSTTRRASAVSEWSISEVGCTEVTERTTSSPNGSRRCAIPTSRPRRPCCSRTSNTDSTRTPSRGAKLERMPCSIGLGAGEHRGEADDGARGVGRLDREVLGALAREPVHDRRVRLPEPAAVAAVDDDDVHAAGERLAFLARIGRPVRARGSSGGARGRRAPRARHTPRRSQAPP